MKSTDGLCVCGCEAILTGRQTKYASAKCSKLQGRRDWVMKVYGITLEEYEVILAYQDGGCAICGKKPTRDKPLHIDHEHGGYVRGLLDSYCNTRLVGRLKSYERARKLADYLEDPPAIKALGRPVTAPGRPRKKRQPRKKAR